MMAVGGLPSQTQRGNNADAPAPPVPMGGPDEQPQRPSGNGIVYGHWGPALANATIIQRLAWAAHDSPGGVAALLGVDVAATDGTVAEAALDFARRARHAGVVLEWFKRRCPLTPTLAEMLGVRLGSSEQTVRRAVLKLQAAYDAWMAARKKLGLKPDATGDEVFNAFVNRAIWLCSHKDLESGDSDMMDAVESVRDYGSRAVADAARRRATDADRKRRKMVAENQAQHAQSYAEEKHVFCDEDGAWLNLPALARVLSGGMDFQTARDWLLKSPAPCRDFEHMRCVRADCVAAALDTGALGDNLKGGLRIFVVASLADFDVPAPQFPVGPDAVANLRTGKICRKALGTLFAEAHRRLGVWAGRRSPEGDLPRFARPHAWARGLHSVVDALPLEVGVCDSGRACLWLRRLPRGSHEGASPKQ